MVCFSRVFLLLSFLLHHLSPQYQVDQTHYLKLVCWVWVQLEEDAFHIQQVLLEEEVVVYFFVHILNSKLYQNIRHIHTQVIHSAID